MNLKKILSNGILFSDAEEDLAFRIQFLNALILIAIITAPSFILLDLLKLRPLYNNLLPTQLYSLVAIFLFWYTHGRKHAYITSAWIILVASYLEFNTTYVFMSQDELRINWYYILVTSSYILLGSKAGLIFTFASITYISYAKFALGIDISNYAFFTFILSLSVTSVITYAYTNLANSYFKRMTYNFNQMQKLASKDPLTGLWNARAFYDMSNNLIQIGQRNNTSYCTLFIDLDHFKSINDQYGHDAGDAVLRSVSACIVSNSRESDIVGRIGGEEFVVFLPNTDLNGACRLAEKLRQRAESLKHTFLNNEQRAVTLSIGVAQNESSDQSIADIQKRADMAMYEAKKHGRNRVSILSVVAT